MKRLMDNDIEKIVFTNKQIKKRIKELSKQINKDYYNKNLVIICVLKGSFMVFAQLAKYIKLDCGIDFIQASSYGSGVKSAGVVTITKDVSIDIKDMDVLIIEDILDSGNTLNFLKNDFVSRGASSVKIFTLLDKPSGRQVDIKADYVGFTVPSCFIVGYGLDYNQKYRNLPYIGILKESVYTEK